MLGVLPEGENAIPKAFWIQCDFGNSYPESWAYECSRCESVSPNALRECPVCGAEMSNMVVQYMWVDFDQ